MRLAPNPKPTAMRRPRNRSPPMVPKDVFQDEKMEFAFSGFYDIG